MDTLQSADMETVLLDGKLKSVGAGPEEAAGGKVMKPFHRREALLRTVVFFAAALVLAACNHQSGEGGPKTTHENDKDNGNGNGGGGGGY